MAIQAKVDGTIKAFSVERQGPAIDGDLLHLPQCVVLLVLSRDKLADQARAKCLELLTCRRDAVPEGAVMEWDDHWRLLAELLSPQYVPHRPSRVWRTR